MLEEKINIFLQKEYDKISDYNKKTSYRISDCGPPWIGALLSHLVHCMNFSYQNGYELSMSNNDYWKMKPDGNFCDVFSGLKTLNDNNFSINNFYDQNTRISYNINRDSLNVSFRENCGYFYPTDLKDLLHTENKHVLNDIWKSFLLKKIYVLSENYQKKIDNKICNLKITDKYAAIHIRRGDKVSGPLQESFLIPVSDYFSKLENSKYSDLKNIFIATDSNEALEECINLYGNKYNLIYDKSETRHNGFPLKIIQNKLNLSETSEEELITALKNFHILSRSDVLIGTPASWFFRISMLLRPYMNISNILYAESLERIPNYPVSYYHC
jgi:hypothetical protein